MRNRVASHPAEAGHHVKKAGRYIVGALLVIGLSARVHAQVGNTPGSGFTTIIGSAMRYVMAYEQKFALRDHRELSTR